MPCIPGNGLGVPRIFPQTLLFACTLAIESHSVEKSLLQSAKQWVRSKSVSFECFVLVWLTSWNETITHTALFCWAEKSFNLKIGFYRLLFIDDRFSTVVQIERSMAATYMKYRTRGIDTAIAIHVLSSVRLYFCWADNHAAPVFVWDPQHGIGGFVVLDGLIHSLSDKGQAQRQRLPTVNVDSQHDKRVDAKMTNPGKMLRVRMEKKRYYWHTRDK